MRLPPLTSTPVLPADAARLVAAVATPALDGSEEEQPHWPPETEHELGSQDTIVDIHTGLSPRPAPAPLPPPGSLLLVKGKTTLTATSFHSQVTLIRTVTQTGHVGGDS